MYDEIELSDIRYALRRSRIRVWTLLALLSIGEAYEADLARAAGVREHRLRGAMFGEPETFRTGSSLVTLGLVVAIRHAEGTRYRITALGRRIARQIAAETVQHMELSRKART